MQMITANPLQEPLHLAIVVSRFNSEVTSSLLDNALQRLKELNVYDEYITVTYVPGAIEIPLAVQRLAKTNIYEAIICLGAVIRGETGHYDYVCEQVSQGCQRVALEQDVPVIFCVLTTENEEQALARVDKGRDSVNAAVEMASVLRQLEG